MQSSLFTYLTEIPYFLNYYVIPFLLAIAFLFFIVNVIRYFVIESASEDGQKHAKAQALYSIAAFVFIFIFWGLIEMLTYSLGFEENPPPCPDYLINAPGNPCSGYR